jgi:hypothetical protein
MEGLRGELLFCFSSVRNLESVKKKKRYKKSPAAIAETWSSGRGELMVLVR